MKIGNLVKDKITELMGIVINFHWDDCDDEVYAIVLLHDNSMVLCTYEDIEIIACPSV